jgi:hypothetical protein
MVMMLCYIVQNNGNDSRYDTAGILFTCQWAEEFELSSYTYK